MLPHFVNLLSRAWADVLQALGTTTLSIVLFSVFVPAILWLVSVAGKWKSGRQREPPLTLGEAFGESLRSALVTGVVTLIVWAVVICSFVTRRVYSEHFVAMKTISDLRGAPPPQCPSCPACSKPVGFVEPYNSLRRRTIRLVEELNKFWSRKTYPSQMPIQNATSDADRRKNAEWDQYWRDAKAEYLNANYRDRLVGIVREYKNKGVETGTMEQAFEQQERLVGSMPFGGWQLDNCSQYMNELCQLRELAYHVDAHDQAIFLVENIKK
jgi:hypothetical protein